MNLQINQVIGTLRVLAIAKKSVRCHCSVCSQLCSIPKNKPTTCPNCSSLKSSNQVTHSWQIIGSDGTTYPSKRKFAQALGITLHMADRYLDPSENLALNDVSYRKESDCKNSDK